MPKIEDRIATLKGRLQQLEARKQQIAARRKALEARRQRTEETRRRILVGAIVLAKIEGGEFDRERLRGWLDEGLTRADDRALFGLPKKEKEMPGLVGPADVSSLREQQVKTDGADRSP